jgi:hypothetical protein
MKIVSMLNIMKIATLATISLMNGCVRPYELKGYDVGLSTGKNIYNNYDLGVSSNAYTSATINTVFHFSK